MADLVSRSVIKSDLDSSGYARGAQQMAAASEHAAAATDRLTAATDRTKRTVADSQSSFDRLRARYDAAYEAQAKLEKATAAYERVQKTVTAAVERNAGLQAAGNRILEQAAKQYLGIATAAEKAAAAQAKYNAAAGVKAPTSEDDYKKRAADIAAYGAEMDRLRGKYNPLFAAAQKYKSTLTEIAQAEKVGALSAKEAAAAREAEKTAFAAQVRAMQGVGKAHAEVAATAQQATNSLGLQRSQVQNLTAQFVDLGTQLASGGGVFLPLVQQGPQAIDAVGGVGNALRIVGQVLTPQRVAVVAFAAAMVGAVVVAEKQAAALATLSNRLRATRNDYEALAKSANAAAIGAAGNSSISTADARASAQTIAGSRNFSGTTAELQALVELSGRLATVMGVETAAAAEKLANALNRPAAAAREMAESGLRTMDERLLHTIEGMERSGRVTEAARLTLDAYRRAADGVVKTPLAEAWDKLTQAASRLWHEISPLVEWIGDKLARALAFVIDRVTSFVSGIESGIRAVREFLGLANQTPAAAAPQRSQLDIALEAARNIGGRGASREAIQQQRQALTAGMRDPTATAQDIARLRDSMQSLAEQERGLIGPTEQAMRALRNQTEAARAGDGAARDLAEAQIQMREAGGGAAAQAAAMAEAQERLNVELDNAVQATEREAEQQYHLANAYMVSHREGTQVEIALRAQADAAQYTRRGTLAHVEATGKLAAAYATLADRQERVRNARAIADQELQIALTQREIELVGATVEERNRELAALRERQRIISEGGDVESELAQRRIQNARQIADANTTLERQNDLYNELSNFGSQAFDRIGSAITEAFANGSISAIKFKDIAKAVLSEIIQLAIKLAVINPIKNWATGSNNGTIYDLFTRVGGTAVAGAATNGGGSSTDSASTALAGRTLMGGFPRFADGSVTSGVGSIYAPGYQANTGFGLVDSAANYNVYGGVSALQAGAGALSIAGGAYGVYSGLQTGGARGYTQAGAGAVGMAGGAAGLAVAGGMTTGAGALAGGAMGTAIAATAAWAPYIAAALAIAAMFMKSGDPTNAAAGANINMTAGEVRLENSGKQTDATAGARDEMAKLVTSTVDRISNVLGVRPSGYIGFELGQRDPSRVIYNGNEVGSAGVGDQQGLANLIGKTIMMGFKDAPGLSAVERRVLDAADSNIDMAANLLQQTKAIKDTYGAGALDYGRNYATQAIWSTAEKTGNIETMIAALGKAAELTAAYGDALGPINEVATKAIDMAWATGNVDTVINAFKNAAELTKAYGEALDPNQNKAFRAIFDAAAATGNVDTFIKAMQGAAELTKAYGDALNSADAMQVVSAGGANVEKIVSDLQWLFQVYRPLTGADDQISALAKAVEESNKTYDAAIAKARELGLAEDKLTANREKAAEAIRQQVRDSFDALMLEATGGAALTQAVNAAKSIRANWSANHDDYLMVGRNPDALYAEQMQAAFRDLDIATLEKVVEAFNGLDEGAVYFAKAAIDAAKATEAAAKATEAANAAAARLATAQSYDAAMREAMGNGWVNQIINLAETVAANADAFRDAGRDPNALLSAQIQRVIDGLDTATLATAAANLQGLDSVTSEFVQAAIATAQATAAMADAAAQAAQRIADAADYDAKMRSAMGLELVNTIVAIRQQIDAMASRYIAAGRDPNALYAAQVSASLQGKSIDELAKTAAALQGIDQAAAALATSALEQAIATQAQAEAQAAAAQAQADAAAAAEQAQQAAAQAAQEAAAAQEQAAQEARAAAEALANAGQNIKDYITKLKSSPEAGFSPQQRLTNAQSAYNSDLALSQQGDLDALNRITSSADALIQASRDMYGASSQFTALRDQIISQLTALPAVQSADQQMIDGLDGIRTSIETSNTRLSSISSSTASTVSGVASSNSLLSSIDTNGDGVISQMEASVAAQNLIKASAAQNVTATGQVKDAVVAGNQTGYSDNELLNGIFGQLASLRLQISDVRLDLATTNTTADWIRKYTGAAAINTMYARPVAQEPGIGAINALGNIFDQGNVVAFARGGIPDMVSSPTVAPLALFGEAGPEAIMPLDRGPDGRLGVRMYSGANDNSEVADLLRAILADRQAGRRQSAKQAAAVERRLAALEAGIGGMAAPLKRVISR